jgi:type IV pilus assembly protein PilA
MKSEFKTKLIQHILNKKNGEKGFTLIELLVVIIIIGILAAIALPSFLNQASKARQSEAKTYVGSMNRAQQSYYLEKQQFAPNLTALAVGIAQTTENYGYGALRNASKTTGTGTQVSVGVYGIANPAGPTSGTGTNPDTVAGGTASTLKSYVGGVSVSTPTGSNEATTLASLCETNLAPVNGGLVVNSTNAIGTYLTLSTAAAPACITTSLTGIQ